MLRAERTLSRGEVVDEAQFDHRLSNYFEPFTQHAFSITLSGCLLR